MLENGECKIVKIFKRKEQRRKRNKRKKKLEVQAALRALPKKRDIKVWNKEEGDRREKRGAGGGVFTRQ